MKKNIVLFLAVLFFSSRLLCIPKIQNSKAQQVSFTENKGQVHDQYDKPRTDVLFSGTTDGMVFHLKQRGISYQLNRIDTSKEEKGFKFNTLLSKRKVAVQTTIYRVDIDWAGVNQNYAVKKEKLLEEINNYYLQNCGSGITSVRSYGKIIYKNLYSGIDLIYYEKDGELKYDYLIQPKINYKQIKLKISGADNISVNEKGELIISTPLGKIIEQAPLVYQNGRSLKSNWVINDQTVSFNIQELDSNLAFRIDPAVRIWGTYYGGSQYEESFSCATDINGNVFMSGVTQTAGGIIIATSGSHQTSYGGGSNDAFLVKFNSSGNRLWGTYYGGAGNDYGYGCAPDSLGNIYLCGATQSTASAVFCTSGCQQPIYGGGALDAFLVKFTSNGIRIWSTFLGGTGDDLGYSCATGSSGKIYLTGTSSSSLTNEVSTLGSHQPTGDGTPNGFLCKFDSSGSRIWGTYYGDSGIERSFSCCVDKFENIYMCGYSTTTVTGTAIATPGAFLTFNPDPNFETAFLVKFNLNGVRQWGTFYGGLGEDVGFSCSADTSGNVYLTGQTATTSTLMTTSGSQQPLPNGGREAFLCKFNGAGVRLWATFYGSGNEDAGTSCTTDRNNNIYLAGFSEDAFLNGISTPGSHQYANGAGIFPYDGFVAKFNSSGVRQWGTYYGGSGEDRANSCCTYTNGSVYLCGYTYVMTSTAIATPGSHQSTYGLSGDGFLAKFYDCANSTFSITQGNILCFGGNNGSASVTATGSGPFNYTWTPVVSSTNSAINLSAGTYTCAITNTCPSTTSLIITITQPTAALSSISSNSSVCQGYSKTLYANVSGGTPPYSYLWSTTSTNSSVVVSPTTSTLYSYTITDNNNCTKTANINLTVNNAPIVVITPSVVNACNGTIVSFTATGATTYTWFSGNSANTSTFNATGTIGSASTNVSYGVVGSNGCPSTTTVSINIYPTPTLNIAPSNFNICAGTPDTLSVLAYGGNTPGFDSYLWNTSQITSSIIITPSVTTSYSVVITNSYNCSESASTTISVSPCVGIKEYQISENTIKIIPNPNNGNFSIVSKFDVSIEINNSLGQRISVVKLNSENNHSCYLTNLAEGIYYLRDVSESEKLYFKMIIIK